LPNRAVIRVATVLSRALTQMPGARLDRFIRCCPGWCRDYGRPASPACCG
jgi:hypothetical protein